MRKNLRLQQPFQFPADILRQLTVVGQIHQRLSVGDGQRGELWVGLPAWTNSVRLKPEIRMVKSNLSVVSWQFSPAWSLVVFFIGLHSMFRHVVIDHFGFRIDQ